MKVLLLTEPYPPEPLVGATRARNVALAFSRQGHEVRVIAGRAGGTDFPADPSITLRIAAAWGAPVHHFVADVLQRRFGKFPVLRHVAELAGTPDHYLGFVPAALLAAWQSTDFDLLYSTSPSHSVHLAALAIQQRLRIPWIAEFRDPWIENTESSQRGLAAFISARLERLVFRKATAVVAVTEHAGDLFRGKMGAGRAGRVLVALNGINSLRIAPAPRSGGDRVLLVYSGSLYPPRSLAPFLECAAALHRAGTHPPFEIMLVGDCMTYGTVDMPAYCRDLGLEGVVRFLGWLPQEEAQHLVNGADIVLLPGQGWVAQIPNKVYDYLGARVPIVALCEPDSETARILERVGGHDIAYTDRVEQLKDCLDRALRAAGGDRPAVGSIAVLSELSTRKQLDRLVSEMIPLVAQERGAGRTAPEHVRAGSILPSSTNAD